MVADIHPHLTDSREELRLVYQPSVALEAPTHPSPYQGESKGGREVATKFEQQLEALRPRELGAALTLVGPHRDDVRFLIQRNHGASPNPIDAITYASRGQGRTIALSLKLAEVALMKKETGEDPILLLDDVMSELDASRRAALAQTVIDAPQALITATDLQDFTPEFLERARVLQVCDGAIL